MEIYSTAQMRAYDRDAIEAGIPSLVLMEHAALRVVEFLEGHFSPLHDKRIAIFCGKGNNGGDGLACARLLQQTGAEILLLLAHAPDELKGDARIQYQILRQHTAASDSAGMSQWVLTEELTEVQREQLLRCDIALDALLGTGFEGELRGAGLLRALELLKSTFAERVAIDIPSGLNGDSGVAASRCVPARYTVTFGGVKKGMLEAGATSYCGEIWIGSIGADHPHQPRRKTGLKTLDARFAADHVMRWTQRSVSDDKRAAGKVLLCGGSLGMSGAPTLSASAALRSGAGLCIAALPQTIIPIFASAVAEATSLPLPDDENGRLIPAAFSHLQQWWSENDGVMALGPGLSRSAGAQELVRQIALECPLPLLVDADALHALSPIAAQLRARKNPLLLTPHGGEIAALLEISPRDLPRDRIATAQQCADKYGAIVVYKGHHSVVAAPSHYEPQNELERDLAKSTFVNLSGNPGMASGGSGDVLTGIVAGMLAQNSAQPFLAVLMSVYLHGLAGDIAFERFGNGLKAGDIADAFPQAMKRASASELRIINNRLFFLQ